MVQTEDRRQDWLRKAGIDAMGRHRFALMSPDNLIYFIPYLGQSTKREGNVNNLLSFQR